MERSFRGGEFLFLGIALVLTGLSLHFILLEAVVWTWLLLGAGVVLGGLGLFALRKELSEFLQRRRGEIAVTTLGVVGVVVAIAWLSVRFPFRIDMTEEGAFSLSPQTVTMLQRLDRPVHVVFFHDPMMRETVELYQLMASKTSKLSVEFYDPMLNPAQARLMGVQFAGTALLESEGRKLQVNSPTETDIANAILRVSRASTQRICFLEGHGEPDPFSIESHDHMEGEGGHSHGLGSKMVVHEQHGMAKAKNALETMNYVVEKVSLMKATAAVDKCTVLIEVGPKLPLLPQELEVIRNYLAGGGNAMFLLDPFVKTGLEPVLRDIGVVVDNDIVIDDASHFWADPSSPAVSDYNRHQITRDLPLTFFPGARSLSPTSERIPGISALPLANSSKSSFGETTQNRAEYEEGKDLQGPLTLVVAIVKRLGGQEADKSDTDKPEPGSVAAKKKSRIVVFGDSDFATNSFFNVMGNGKLFLNTVNYLAAQENLIGVEPRTFDVPRVNLTNRQMKGTVFLSVILIPALLALIGTIVWWRQR